MSKLETIEVHLHTAGGLMAQARFAGKSLSASDRGYIFSARKAAKAAGLSESMIQQLLQEGKDTVNSYIPV